MTDRVVVAGDVHLGSENADAAAFDAFLDRLYDDRRAIDQLVLLGDVWDMVRRDPFGVAWETSGTVSRLKRLAGAMPVRYVLGNHDTYLRHLDEARYDVDFRDEYVLESGDASVRFCHGKAFDRLQSDVVSRYLSGAGDRGDIDPTRGLKDPFVASGRKLLQAGKLRLRTTYDAVRGRETARSVTYPRRERRAHAYLETIPEDKLVYGHTHSPYVHPENTAANPGSWKRTAPLHNTYLVIEDGDMTLYRHRTGEPDEPVNAVGSQSGAGRQPGRRTA